MPSTQVELHHGHKAFDWVVNFRHWQQCFRMRHEAIRVITLVPTCFAVSLCGAKAIPRQSGKFAETAAHTYFVMRSSIDRGSRMKVGRTTRLKSAPGRSWEMICESTTKSCQQRFHAFRPWALCVSSRPDISRDILPLPCSGSTISSSPLAGDCSLDDRPAQKWCKLTRLRCSKFSSGSQRCNTARTGQRGAAEMWHRHGWQEDRREWSRLSLSLSLFVSSLWPSFSAGGNWK